MNRPRLVLEGRSLSLGIWLYGITICLLSSAMTSPADFKFVGGKGDAGDAPPMEEGAVDVPMVRALIGSWKNGVLAVHIDGRVRAWSPELDKPTEVFALWDDPLTRAGYVAGASSGNGEHLAVGWTDSDDVARFAGQMYVQAAAGVISNKPGRLRMLNTASGKIRDLVLPLGVGVTDLGFSKDGRYLYVGGLGRVMSMGPRPYTCPLTVFDTSGETPGAVTNCFLDTVQIMQLDVGPRGDSVAVASVGMTQSEGASIWNPLEGSRETIRKGHANAVVWLNENAFLYTANGGGLVRASRGKEEWEKTPLAEAEVTGEVVSVRVHPDGNLLAYSDSRNAGIQLYRYPEMEKISSLMGLKGTAYSIHFIAGKTISATDGQSLAFWNTSTGALSAEIKLTP